MTLEQVSSRLKMLNYTQICTHKVGQDTTKKSMSQSTVRIKKINLYLKPNLPPVFYEKTLGTHVGFRYLRSNEKFFITFNTETCLYTLSNVRTFNIG